MQMTFEHQLKALIFYHLEEHSSGSHLVQVLDKDDFAKREIAPPEGIQKSSFFDAINHRGLEQLLFVFEKLQADATKTLPKEYAHLGNLISIDGSLIDAVLSMHWADYRDSSKKAKVHLGFDINHSIPTKIFLTDGKGDERPFVSKILSPGQTGRVDGKKYWVATDRYDITAEEVAYIYKLRWDIEIFFGWWKRHLKVYHLIARSQYGLMVQILAGLITYMLIAIYCRNNFNEKVSIKRVRELRIKIKNEAGSFDFDTLTQNDFKEQRKNHAYAKT